MKGEIPRRRFRVADVSLLRLVLLATGLGMLIALSAGSAAAVPHHRGAAELSNPLPGTTFPPTAIATATAESHDPWSGPDLVGPPATLVPARFGLSAADLTRERAYAFAHLHPRPLTVGSSAVGRRHLTRSTRVSAPPSLRGPNFAGVTQATACGGCAPPDTEGAVGTQYFGETTNSHIDMYAKTNGSRVQSRTLASFFGYTTTTLFDSRIVKDPSTARWIVTTIGFNEPGAGSPQRLFIAISNTEDITGNWCFYALNVNYSGDDFFDFPMLGIDQSALIVTGNVFSNSTGSLKYGEILALPKAQVMSCQTVTYTIFSGFPHNMAPPIVYDANATSYLVSAPESGSALSLYGAQNLGTREARH